MITAPHQTSTKVKERAFLDRWYFTGMAIAMLAVSVAGFMPAMAHPATRRAPLSLLAALHGIVFFAWQLLYLAQSLLVATRRVAWHRMLGPTSVVLLALMIPLGYTTTTAMIQRGFDLSGDQHIDPHPATVGPDSLDAPTASVFNFGALLTFGVLAIAAVCYRRRPEIHKRLMLFANIALMSAPITHFFGHLPHVRLTAPVILIPYALFLLAVVARDYLVEKRVRMLTAALAIGMFAALPLQALVIGPSETWHRFAVWLSR